MGPILKNLFLFSALLILSALTQIARAETEELLEENYIANADEINLNNSLDPIHKTSSLKDINRTPAIIDSDLQIENDAYDPDQYAEQNFDPEYQMDTEPDNAADDSNYAEENYSEDYNTTYEE